MAAILHPLSFNLKTLDVRWRKRQRERKEEKEEEDDERNGKKMEQKRKRRGEEEEGTKPKPLTVNCYSTRVLAHSLY